MGVWIIDFSVLIVVAIVSIIGYLVIKKNKSNGRFRYKYRILRKGEVVREGDEIDLSVGWNDEPDWSLVSKESIGTIVPDPSYPAYRIYRRKIK